MSSNPSSEPVSESTETDFTELLGPALAAAFAKKGYTELTQVQRAVLAPQHAGRDLRISSQTGSGKTLAIGFALRNILSAEAAPSASQTRSPMLKSPYARRSANSFATDADTAAIVPPASATDC